jgi:alpha-tubulin suppressor-like RCC1 family protein
MKRIIYLFIYLFSITSYCQCWQQISVAPFNSQGAYLGGNYSAGIQINGTLWTWGNNSEGQLGDGTTTNRSVPTQVGTATDWVWVSAGTNATYAIKQNGTLWAWGSNNHGQLGDGTTTSRLLPAQVLPGTTWSKVSAGDAYVVAQKTNGTLWSCGYNFVNQLGLVNDISDVYTFSQISSDADWLDFKTGTLHTVLLKTNYTYWCWGDGSQGGLGTGNDIGSDHPISPLSDTDWAQVTSNANTTLFRKINGTLWGVGNNSVGQLGQGVYNTVYYTVQQIGTSTDWSSLESNTSHTMVLKNDGTLWSCGYNNKGQLGIGTTTNTNTLAQVGSSTWSKVRCGRWHTLALDSNGSLWAWGDNSYGQLGDGTTTNRLVPNLIGTPCSLSTSSFTRTTMRLLANPVSQFMSLAFDRDGTKDITVYNSHGVLLAHTTIDSDFISMDVSGYASGVYFVKCTINNETQCIKVLKE